MYYYDPQSAGINLQSPQSDSTPLTLTLSAPHKSSGMIRGSIELSLAEIKPRKW